ncbi:MAG: response regulator, partial [Nitrospira sp.]|nr:response regulator [Nitrospira sp.]
KVVLEGYGLSIDEAGNGLIGVEMATAGEYDIILMDMQMPEMDGLTATRTLRNRGLQIPILALTANAMKGFEQELFDAGFSDYLTKPIDIDRFLAKLAQFLHGQPVGQSSAQAVLPESSHHHASPIEDSSPIVSKLGSSNPKFANVIARFVGRLGEQLQAMDAAYSNRDMEALAKLAHWLKGAGGTVGFDVLNLPAAELEAAAKAADLAAIEQHLHHLQLLATRIAHGAGGTIEPVGVGVSSACKSTGEGPG